MNFSVEFFKPENITTGYADYIKMIKEEHKKIGFDKLSSRLEQISFEWAKENEYFLTVENNEKLNLIFTHIEVERYKYSKTKLILN